MNIITYKGYEAHVQYDEDAKIFHGEVMTCAMRLRFR